MSNRKWEYNTESGHKPLKQFIMILPANKLTINTQSLWMMHWIYVTLDEQDYCCTKLLWITYGWITALTILLAVTGFVFVNGNSSIQSQCRINSYASQSNSQQWCFEWNSVFKIPVCPSVVINEDLKPILSVSRVQCVRRFILQNWHKMFWNISGT